jgi:branched-chain amino acid transport system substrate-binding protein
VPRGMEGVCNPSNYAPDDHRGTLRVGLYRARVTGDTSQGSVAELMRAGTMKVESVATIELDRKREWLGW